MLTCYRTRRRLGAYLDGALDSQQASAAARHLERCGRCRDEVAGLRRLRQVLRETLAVPGPSDWTGFWPGIVRGIDRSRQAPAPVLGRQAWQGRRQGWTLRLAYGSALAAVLIASAMLWQTRGPVSPEGPLVVEAANTEYPNASVMVYAPPERDMTVVWVFGVEN